MIRLAIGLTALAALTAAMPPFQSPPVRRQLAPSGRLRVGINFGNALLTGKDPSTGAPKGIAIDLANELGRRLGVAIDIVAYDAAGKMADGAKSGAWDVAFLGSDPDRAGDIAFTAPYLEIDATYLVPAGSPLRTVSDVDREGVRVAVTEKSAYDLFLTRNLQHARLLHAPNTGASVTLFTGDRLEALAGLKPALMDVAATLPGSKVLEGRFQAVEQAVGMVRGRGDAAAAYLREFVHDVKTSGLVARVIAANGVRGVAVAP